MSTKIPKSLYPCYIGDAGAVAKRQYPGYGTSATERTIVGAIGRVNAKSVYPGWGTLYTERTIVGATGSAAKRKLVIEAPLEDMYEGEFGGGLMNTVNRFFGTVQSSASEPPVALGDGFYRFTFIVPAVPIQGTFEDFRQAMTGGAAFGIPSARDVQLVDLSAVVTDSGIVTGNEVVTEPGKIVITTTESPLAPSFSMSGLVGLAGIAAVGVLIGLLMSGKKGSKEPVPA